LTTKYLNIFLIVLAGMGLVPATVQAGQCKEDCGVIQVGQPKLWSLGDAQNLVGEARNRLKALRVALPGESAGAPGVVDPNEIDIYKIDILMQSLGITAQYDQGAALTNKMAQKKYRQDLGDYQKNKQQQDSLTSQINQISAQKSGLDKQIQSLSSQLDTWTAQDSDLTSQIATANSALDTATKATSPDPDAIARLKKNLAALQDREQQVQKQKLAVSIQLSDVTPQRDRLEGQLTDLEAQQKALPVLTASTLSVTATGPPSADDLKNTQNPVSTIFSDPQVKAALVDSLKKAIAHDPKAPYVVQLNNVMDGYLQTISRQLTMLRQSVDANFDLYFMELGSSVEPSSRVKNHFARARWVIGSAPLDEKALAEELVSEKRLNEMADTAVKQEWTVSDVSNIASPSKDPDDETNLLAGCNAAENKPRPCRGIAGTLHEYRDIAKAAKPADLDGQERLGSNAFDDRWVKSTLTNDIRKYLEESCRNGDNQAKCSGLGTSRTRKAYFDLLVQGVLDSNNEQKERLKNMKPYVFELTPQQAATNVANGAMRSSTLSIVGIFKLISGIGASVSYQRQHDSFSQFLEQDVFEAATGKGSTGEFGWDFGPVTGGELVSPGVYTTYGVLAVPSFRKSITFTTKADWVLKAQKGGKPGTVAAKWANASSPENTAYTVYLPGRYDFWVDAVYYSRVPVGEEISVIVRGKGFTNETMALVNNIPLTPRWRLIDPAASDVSYAGPNGATPPAVENGGGNRKTFGAFELMSSDTIAMRFRAPGFDGVPQITLLSPHRSVQINDLPLAGNYSGLKKLSEIESDYEEGLYMDHIMFGPGPDWRDLTGEDFLHLDGDATPTPHTDLRLHFGHMPLRGDTVEVFDGAKATFAAATPVTVDQEVDTLLLNGAPVYNGDVTVRLKAPGSGEVLFEGRVPVPLKPRIGKLSSNGGPAAGGETVSITGLNFAHVTTVFFGDAQAGILSLNDSEIRVKVPKGIAGTDAAIRLVSELKPDGKELASAENQIYTYAKPPSDKPKLIVIDKAAWGSLGTEPRAPKVTVNATLNPPDDAGTLSVQQYDGSKWIEVAISKNADKTYELKAMKPMLGQVKLQLSAKGKNDKNPQVLGDPLTFDVPYTPELDAVTPQAGAAGEQLMITGKNLQADTSVTIGSDSVTIVSKSYGQVVVTIPKESEVGNAPSHKAQIRVNTDGGGVIGPLFGFRQ
jgi:hypothetical protein